MKRYLPILFALLALSYSSCRKKAPSAEGYWQGTIMGQFTLILDVKHVGKDLQGRIYAFDGDFLFQDDTLQQFMFKGDSLFFYIPDKETRFAGLLSENTLDGNLLFSDGGMTPATFQRKAQAELAEAGLLPNIIPPPSVLTERFELGKLQSDFDQFVDLLRKSHPALYEYQTESDFEESVATIRSKIRDGMTVREFVPIVMELSASIGCSHTRVRPSRKIRMAMENYTAMLPLQFSISGETILIEGGISTDPSFQGLQVMNINNTPSKDIVSSLMSIIPAEAMYSKAKEYEFNRYQTSYLPFVLTDSLLDIGYISQGKEEHISPKTVKVLDLPWRSPNYNPEWTLQNIKSKHAALLRIPTFAFPEPLDVPHWLDSVFTLIADEDIKTLIIDIRGNEGGPPYPARILLSYLIDRPFAYFASNEGIPEDVQDLTPLYQALPESPKRYSGKLIVLSDAGVMSTAGHFLSLIRYFKAGLIAGQAPGSHMACSDNTFEAVLSNTGIECAIPRTRFVTNVSGMTPNQVLAPDIPFNCCSGIPEGEMDPLVDYLLDKVLK